MGGYFGCIRILARFKEQDLKFGSFGNLGLNYTLLASVHEQQWSLFGPYSINKVITIINVLDLIFFKKKRLKKGDSKPPSCKIDKKQIKTHQQTQTRITDHHYCFM